MSHRLDALDELDRNLIALLQANAREPVAALARKLGVARTTVLARLARLENNRVVSGYTVTLGQEVEDAGMHASVGITLQPRAGRGVISRLQRMPEVRLLCAVSGEYDYLAWLRADTPGQLDQLLDQIGEMEGVIKTNTSVVLARKIDRGWF